ncbi:MAG: Na+/H+ antiporter subunit C [Chromatiaceae bacterium]|nr:MAG: Na+/H+ antiporter subunit C [Chromatiaceae bacterium]
MTPASLYALVGVGLIVLGLYALSVHAHLLRKLLAFNVTGSGVFLVLVGLARRTPAAAADPVPQAMVLTGIVVAVAATALAVVLMLRVQATCGRAALNDDLGTLEPLQPPPTPPAGGPAASAGSAEGAPPALTGTTAHAP